MDVCVDIQAAVTQRAGVGRYTRVLVHHLGLTAGEDRLKLFYFDFKRRGHAFDAPHAELAPARWCPGALVQAAWKRFSFPPFELFAPSADLYHFPNFILPPLRRKRPAVVTIHDMSFMRYPEFAEKKNLAYLTARIRDTARRAAAILTISRFSALEIEQLLNVPASRIFAVPLGIGDVFAPPSDETRRNALRSLGIERPYLLTVGTLEPRKNIPLAVSMFERMSQFDGELVIAGMKGWKCEPILQCIRASPRAASIRHIEYVTDEYLPSLYAGATLLVFPSFYEGFGFPPLEAMACGTPVLSSSGGSLPEVLGDAAVMLDSYECDRWVEEADRLIHDEDLRREMIRRGLRQAARYTWPETARNTWEIYRRVVQGAGGSVKST